MLKARGIAEWVGSAPCRAALRGSPERTHRFSYPPLEPPTSPSPNILITLVLFISKSNKRDPSKTILTTVFDFIITKLQLFSLFLGADQVAVLSTSAGHRRRPSQTPGGRKSPALLVSPSSPLHRLCAGNPHQ